MSNIDIQVNFKGLDKVKELEKLSPLDIKVPSIKPKFLTPDLSGIKASLANIKLPKLKIPELKIPELKFPKMPDYSGLSKLKMPDLGFSKLKFPPLPDFSILKNLKLPGLPPIAGWAASLALAVTTAVALLKTGLDAAITQIRKGLELQVTLDSSMATVGRLSGTSKSEAIEVLTPQVKAAIGSDTVSTPLAEINQLIETQAGNGFSLNQIGELLEASQAASGATGAAINDAADLIGSTVNSLQLEPNKESFDTVAKQFATVTNLSPAKLPDINLASKYLQLQSDGSSEGNIAALNSNMKVIQGLATRGLAPVDAGSSFRSVQQGMMNTSRLANAGFDIKQTNEDGTLTSSFDRLSQLVSQFVEQRDTIGSDQASMNLKDVVGDVGLASVTKFAAGFENVDAAVAGMEEISRTFDETLARADSIAAQVIADAQKGLSASIAQYGNAVEGLQLNLGEAFSGVAEALTRVTTKAINGLIDEEALARISSASAMFLETINSFDFSGIDLSFLGDALAGASVAAIEFLDLIFSSQVLVEQIAIGFQGIVAIVSAVGTVIGSLLTNLMVIPQILATLGLGDLLLLIGEIAQLVAAVLDLVFSVVGALLGVNQEAATGLELFGATAGVVEQIRIFVEAITPAIVLVASAVSSVLMPAFAGVRAVVNGIASAIEGLSGLLSSVNGFANTVLDKISRIGNTSLDTSGLAGGGSNAKTPATNVTVNVSQERGFNAQANVAYSR